VRAQNFNQLIAFGDSTTDTGWFARASTGFPGEDFVIANSVAKGGNAHFTGPGPGYAQILGGFFGLPANPANVPGGTNYAIGGSVNFLVPAGFPGGTGNLFPNPALPGTATQIGGCATHTRRTEGSVLRSIFVPDFIVLFGELTPSPLPQ
jgi:hypothetical protein